MFVCFFLTADKVGKTDFSGELEEEHFLTKGDAVGVGDIGAAAGMEAKKVLFSPSSAALGNSLVSTFSSAFRRKRSLFLTKQGKERLVSSRALSSPSPAALGHSLFRLFPALSLAVQGEERLDFSRTLDSSKLPFRCIQCAAREGARTRLSSWVQPRHPKYLR